MKEVFVYSAVMAATTIKEKEISIIIRSDIMEPKMFCFQCQETAGNKGCMFGGVCGKKPETANLQDLLIYVTKGLSEITTRLRSEGKEIPAAIDRLITTNLFMTITNANFDDDRFIDRINETLSSRDELF